MNPRSPEDCDRLFSECAKRGDLEGLVSLYEPDAVFVPQGGGEAVTGLAAVREQLAGLVAMKPHMQMNVVKVVQVRADLAVVYNDWTMKAAGPDGAKIEAAGKALEIVRRQPDGTWRYVFDDPVARGA